MKEDIPGIIGGIKNALERGSSIEKAKESFITAGYDAADVEEAAKTLAPAEEKKPQKQVVPAQPFVFTGKMTEKPLPELPKPGAIKQKKKSNWIRNVIIVVSVIVFLLILNILRDMLGITF